MPSRDSQTVILSRQTILLVTAVGVGLLTLCYVLGVQVGKQSAALRHPAARGAGEDLQELPASVADQLLSLDSSNGADAGLKQPPPAASGAVANPAPAPAPAPAAAGKEAAPPAPPPPAPVAAKKAEPPAPVSAAKGVPAVRWTLQLVSTPDPQEAQRMAARVRAAGFPTATVSEKGLFKVRLATPAPRETMDATAQKLKNRGFKPFAMKAE